MASQPVPQTQQYSHEYLHSILPSLPVGLANNLTTLINTASSSYASDLETLIRILVGSLRPNLDVHPNVSIEWTSIVDKVKGVVEELKGRNDSADKKRTRESVPDDDSSTSKRQRLSPAPLDKQTNGSPAGSSKPHADQGPGRPLYTLHALSATSPIRKKVDITICTRAITLVNPVSGLLEGTLPLSCIKRAFILPTRGKTKPHWTVVLMGVDLVVEEKKGKGNPANSSNIQDQQQLIFGIDAFPTAAFSTTTHPSASPSSSASSSTPSPTAHAKSTATLPLLQIFLSHLPTSIAVLQPTASVFKSSCPPMGTSKSTSASNSSDSGPEGVPGVEAYKGAKSGTLWLMKQGLLWGESKPCEFWALEDIVAAGQAHANTDGVRVIGSAAGGRTCSVVITRRRKRVTPAEGEDEDEEEEGDETEFGMIDGRERDPIQQWIMSHRPLFGRSLNGEKVNGSNPAAVAPRVPKITQLSGPTTIHTLMMEEEDEEDEDFTAEVSDLDGSEGMSDEGNSSQGGNSDAEGEEEEEGGSDGEGSDEEPLDPAHHPLLRPGAMPKRMTRAAIDMVVGIVENDLVGGRSTKANQDEDEEMEDELED